MNLSSVGCSIIAVTVLVFFDHTDDLGALSGVTLSFIQLSISLNIGHTCSFFS